MVEIISIINIWLIAFTLIGLAIGVYRFNRLPMIGSWFKWKSVTWTLITLYDFVGIYYVLKGQPLFIVIRLCFTRLAINWEIWYCFHYLFFKVYTNGRTPDQTIDRVINAINQDSGC